MWIVKGVVLGIVLFIIGGITFVGIDIAIGMHRLAQQLRAGTAKHGGGAMVDTQSFVLAVSHRPVLWAVFLLAIAIGLWIMRVRMTHTVPPLS